METICPLLTLAGDRRAVSAGPDTAHRCAAGASLQAIDRSHQLRFCLGGGYETCERFRGHVSGLGPVGPTWSAAAPDSTFVSTRLVMDAAPRVGFGAGRPQRWRWVLAVLALLAAGAATAWLLLGGPGGAPGWAASPSAFPSAVASPTGSALGIATPTPTPSVTAGQTPTPAPTPASTPGPTPVTYIVQAGDTLNAIAARFGTTAQDIMAANGLTSDVIHPGQVLIIPPS